LEEDRAAHSNEESSEHRSITQEPSRPETARQEKERPARHELLGRRAPQQANQDHDEDPIQDGNHQGGNHETPPAEHGTQGSQNDWVSGASCEDFFVSGRGVEQFASVLHAFGLLRETQRGLNPIRTANDSGFPIRVCLIPSTHEQGIADIPGRIRVRMDPRRNPAE
jgi:hypothetical protein